MDFSFVTEVTLDEIVPGTRTGRAPLAVTIPENADLRLFKSGRLHPSIAFATENNLEFMNLPKKGEESPIENGLDFFTSLDWGMVKGKLPQEVLFISVIPKSLPKVDVFGQTRYEEDGSPKASVFSQGGGKFVKSRLLDMITVVFNINWETTSYVDLKVAPQVVKSSNGVYHLPTLVASGPNKGEVTYKTRNNIVINPVGLVHAEVIVPKVKEDAPGEVDLTFGAKVSDKEAELPKIGTDLKLENKLPGSDLDIDTANDPVLRETPKELEVKGEATSDWASTFKAGN